MDVFSSCISSLRPEDASDQSNPCANSVLTTPPSVRGARSAVVESSGSYVSRASDAPSGQHTHPSQDIISTQTNGARSGMSTVLLLLQVADDLRSRGMGVSQ
ncbi:hypothetical protein OH77DRAFT_1013387 [Trametes cingulata]|nr:hypothetical protein OH77DRAFT_1013387 [Trametes cingulata]